MLRAATVHAVTAIGIDMGKNTLHMIGLDPHLDRGCAVDRWALLRNTDETMRHTGSVPQLGQ